MGKFKAIWSNIESSLWFIPTLMIVVFTGLAFGLVELDYLLDPDLKRQWRVLFAVRAEGSRTILATVANSMITIAGVTFSITIVALSLAANQYTPRVLRNFMRDRSNQVVLGAFVSIFVYCLIVLRTVQGGEESFVPSIAVFASILMGLVGIGCLIYFIHHVASSIQVSSILCTIAEETIEAIRNLYPEDLGKEDDEEKESAQEKEQIERGNWTPILADQSGYIQSLHFLSLLRFAEDKNLLVRMEHSIGDFVTKNTPLISLNTDQVSAAQARQINRMFGLQAFRTVEQDPEFGIRQIVDIALKALSPGINDPATAITCLDYLGTILHFLASRRIPSSFRYSQGKLRVYAPGPSFDHLLNHMFHEIRQNARNSVSINARMLMVLERVTQSRLISSRRKSLWKHATLIAEEASRNVHSPHDREVINRYLTLVGHRLGEDPQPHLLKEEETAEG